MDTVIIAFFVMLALIGAMAVGVIFGRQPIAGSCGGMKALGMEMECEVCGGELINGDCPEHAVHIRMHHQYLQRVRSQYEQH